MTCHICREKFGKGSDPGTCEDCLAVLAAEQTCRSSQRCSEKAGAGRFGMFCPAHADELEDLKARWWSASGNVLQHERKPGEDEQRATWNRTPAKSPNPAARRTREELASLAAAHVAAADGPLTNAEIAAAIGVPRTSSSLRRALEHAKAEGLVILRNGVGWVVPGEGEQQQAA